MSAVGADTLVATLSTGAQEHQYSNLELKSAWKQDHGKKISKLANQNVQDVSFLVVGVADNGKSVGNDDAWAKRTETQISEHVRNYLSPVHACLGISAERLDDDSTVVVVTIACPGVVARWNGRAFTGVGTHTHELTPEEAMALQMKLPGETDYTAQSTETTVDRLDHALLIEFQRGVESRVSAGDAAVERSWTPESMLSELGLMRARVSEILFGNASYRLVALDGGDEVVANSTKRGLLGVLSQDTLGFIRKFSEGEYPERAIQEALANAVGHAFHQFQDGDIIVEVSPSSVSIANVCLPEAGHFANKWFSRSHKTLNPVLMEALRVAGFVDEMGLGKKRIMAESLRLGCPPPRVDMESAGQFSRWKLHLYPKTESGSALKLLETLRENYGDDQKALLSLALVLWSKEHTLKGLRSFVDASSADTFLEVIDDQRGPLRLEGDNLVLRRWAKVRLGYGQQSKALSKAEEDDVLRRLSNEFGAAVFSPQDFRRLAGFGNSQSEQVATQQLLKRWKVANIVLHEQKGQYRLARPAGKSLEDVRQAIEAILKNLVPD